MSDPTALTLTLEGDVVLEDYIEALTALKDLLDALHEEINPGSPPIRWIVSTPTKPHPLPEVERKS